MVLLLPLLLPPSLVILAYGAMRRRLSRCTQFEPTSSEKERIMHALNNIDAPQEIVDMVQAVLKEVSQSTPQNRFQSRYDGRVLWDEYYYDWGGKMLELFYYKDRRMYILRMNTLHIYDSNGIIRLSGKFGYDDGSLIRLRVYSKTGRTVPSYSKG